MNLKISESLTTRQLRERVLAQMKAVVPDNSQAAHRASRQEMYERRGEPDSFGLLPGFLR